MNTYYEKHHVTRIPFKDLKVGDVFVEHLDCLMLGTRLIVESRTEDKVFAQVYSCGKINVRTWVENREEPYWSLQGETISDWAEKMFGVITS
jgi:hypothetical protein